MMLPVRFDFTVKEDRRSINFEGLEAGRGNPNSDGALNLQVRVARDHVVLSIWPVKEKMAGISASLSEILGPPRGCPSVCGFGDCQDDDKDAPQQTTMWEFEPEKRAEILEKIKSFLGLKR